MIIYDLLQNSAEWLDARCGRATGSRVHDITARLLKASNGRQKGDYKQCRYDYRDELVCERLTGLTADHFVSHFMEHGTDEEPLARAAYELACDCEVVPIGMGVHDEMPLFSSSPDGRCGKNGLIEIKCPSSPVHLEYLKAGTVPAEHLGQMLAEMACCDTVSEDIRIEWVDFISFDRRFPKGLQLFIKRFHRDEVLIEQMENEVGSFLLEVEAELERVKQYGKPEEVCAK